MKIIYILSVSQNAEKMNKYQELKNWNKAMDLVEEVQSLMKMLPDDEKFGLISQVKRNSVSISSNIVEGAGIDSDKEFVRFLSIANGSTTELETQLILVVRLKFVSEEKNKRIIKIMYRNKEDELCTSEKH